MIGRRGQDWYLWIAVEMLRLSMSLRGRAFNAMWSDLLEGLARELDLWHTIEHMPERLGVPGFLRGRRYIDATTPGHSMFILYEAAHIETFRSPGLVARLNDPTEWSKQVQPALLNFIRGPCQTLISVGEGVGGAMLTVRMSGATRDRAEARFDVRCVAPKLQRLHGVTAIHIGEHISDTLETAEKRLRPASSPPTFDFVILVEGIGIAELEAAKPDVINAANEVYSGRLDVGLFRLAYLLDEAG
jgi:hypothetical protein